MIDTYLRPRIQVKGIDPVARLLAGWGLHCHSVTALALGLGLTIPLLLLMKLPALAATCLLLSGYLDAVDGSMARISGQDSPVGCVLDIVADRAVESAVIFGLYLVDPSGRAVLTHLMLIAALLCITSFLVVGIFSKNSGEKGFHYSPGLMERGETFLFFLAMLLLPSSFAWLSSLFILLVLYTAAQRVYEFSKI